jgi:ferric-dicitrate binding protein FerR (iron transport regulator)
MTEESTYYENLMNRYFSGEAGENEIAELSSWLRKSEENRDVFTQFRKVWHAMSEDLIMENIDIDEEWLALQAKLSSGKKVEMGRRRTLRIVTRIAAAVLLILTIGFLLRNIIFGADKTIEILAQNEVIETVLPDGSTITLNAGSSLEYPKDINENDQRTVQLTGEAHFEVAHNPEKPFIVSAGDMRVEVLGTSFYVNTNGPDGKVQVILINGSVALYHKDTPDNRTILKPGEQAEATPDKKEISVGNTFEEYFMVWKTRSMSFENERLDRVVNIVSKAYNIPIKLSNPACGNCKLSVSFEDQTLESVLTVLESTLDLKIRKDGNAYIIDGEPCDE